MRKMVKVLASILVVGFVFGLLVLPMSAQAADQQTNTNVKISATVNGKKGTPTEEYTLEGTSYREESLKIFKLINDERAKEGLHSLEWNETTYSMATQRAFEISTHFAHERPDGSSLKTLGSSLNGENLGNGPSGTATDVMKAWMNSPGHRKNILREEFDSVSVATVKINGEWHWVQIFTVNQ